MQLQGVLVQMYAIPLRGQRNVGKTGANVRIGNQQ